MKKLIVKKLKPRERAVTFNLDIEFTEEQIDFLEEEIWDHVKKLGDQYEPIDYDFRIIVSVRAKEILE